MENKGTSESPIYKQLEEIKVVEKEHTIPEEFLPSIPEDIIPNILVSLPVKSLLRFRCVSRSWLFIICDQRFIEAHLKSSLENPKLEHHMVLGTSTQPGFPSQFSLKHCSLRSLLYEPVVHGVNIYPMEYYGPSIAVVGCCNGLVCIAIREKEFFLWNPCTKEARRLPDIDDDLDTVSNIVVPLYGFGFDESGDDYKVFVFFWLYRKDGRMYEYHKVYSLRTNSWKKVDKFDIGGPFFDTRGKFLNGNLHWWRYSAYTNHPIVDFVSFDLGIEVDGIVELPNNVKEGSVEYLTVLGGCLSVLYHYDEHCRTDVWVLKHYGVKESWYKMLSLPYHDGHDVSLRFIAPKGEIIGSVIERPVLGAGQRLVICDPKDDSVRDLQTINFDFFDADFYVESLVSPFLAGEQEK